MKQFMKMFRNYGPIPDQLAEELEQYAVRSIVKKGENLQDFNDPLDQLTFIESGLVMASTFSGLQKNAFWFKKENEFVVTLQNAAHRRIRANLVIEALEDTVVWHWPNDLIEHWCREYSDFALCDRNIILKDIEYLDEFLFNARLGSISDQYDFLKNSDADLVRRIPLKDLASFMKITERGLSKVVNG